MLAVEAIEAETVGVQELALKAEGPALPAGSVEWIAGDGVVFVSKMDADLVGSPGMETGFYQAVTPDALPFAVVGA